MNDAISLAQLCGLHLNFGPGKTEFYSTDSSATLVSLHGIPVTRTTNYKYLGGNPLDPSSLFVRRRAATWHAVHQFDDLWISTAISSVKLQFFNALILPVLTSGCFAWPRLVHDQHSYDGTLVRLLRYCGIGSPSRREALQHGAIPLLSSTSLYRRWCVLGHAVRHDQALTRYLTLGNKRSSSNVLLLVRKGFRGTMATTFWEENGWAKTATKKVEKAVFAALARLPSASRLAATTLATEALLEEIFGGKCRGFPAAASAEEAALFYARCVSNAFSAAEAATAAEQGIKDAAAHEEDKKAVSEGRAGNKGDEEREQKRREHEAEHRELYAEALAEEPGAERRPKRTAATEANDNIRAIVAEAVRESLAANSPPPPRRAAISPRRSVQNLLSKHLSEAFNLHACRWAVSLDHLWVTLL